MSDMLGYALREVCGPLGDLVARLKGKHGDEWLDALKRFLRKENPWPPVPLATPDSFKVWKTVKFDKVPLDLVIVTPEEFGFTFSAPRRAIYERALGLGLALVPAELSVFLCDKCTDLKSHEQLLLGCEPERDERYRQYDKKWRIPMIYRDTLGMLQLTSRGGAPATLWNRATKFVFVLPRK